MATLAKGSCVTGWSSQKFSHRNSQFLDYHVMSTKSCSLDLIWISYSLFVFDWSMVRELVKVNLSTVHCSIVCLCRDRKFYFPPQDTSACNVVRLSSRGRFGGSDGWRMSNGTRRNGPTKTDPELYTRTSWVNAELAYRQVKRVSKKHACSWVTLNHLRFLSIYTTTCRVHTTRSREFIQQ